LKVAVRRVAADVDLYGPEVHARTKLVASVPAHRVGTPAVESLIRRHEPDALAGEADPARREDRPTQQAPRERPAAADRIIARHLELPPVELVQRIRADEPRGVSQRRGDDTPRRGVEYRVRPIPHAGDRDRPERPSVRQERLIGRVTQEEPLAVHRRVGRNTYADFRELSRVVERARAPQEVVGRPPALHPEAVE